ncbi:MAG: neuraminidase-like domain-containing protein [Arenicella sp.]
MTILNNSLSKTPARSQRLLAKAAQRRSVKSGSRPLSFAELVDNPFYRRFAKQSCPDDLSQMISQYGFESAADVAACKTVHTMKARMPSTVDRDLVDQAELQTLLSRSKQEAQRSYRLMRHALAVNDPMNQSLRNINIQPNSLDEPEASSTGVYYASDYAKPTTLQSDQSLAAYLRYLYRIATGLEKEIGILCDQDSSYSLINRRPDLADLVLNESNLKKEVPTLELVNEILSAGLSDIDMGKSFYPIALPYDHVATTTREALAETGGAVINDIAKRISGFDVRSFINHRWAIDQAGLLGLIGALDVASSDGSTVSLLIEDGSESSARPLTLETLYNTTDLNKASQVDHLMSSLDLDFDALAQLVGLYSVSQENGLPVVQQDFATAFLSNDLAFELHAVGDDKSVHMAGAPVSAPYLRSLNYLARLHHATGLAFHQLNTILALPGAAANAATTPDAPRSASRCVTPTGLRVLASYPLYRDAFGVTPEAYAALFGELCPYWRADEVVDDGGSIAGLEQTEVSFLATLFQEHAPTIHRVISNGETSLQDETLASIVARGLGLSALELETLISRLDSNFALTQGLDARGLGALYRLTTLCQMLGWPLLTGLDLIAKLSHGLGDNNALWNALISRNVTADETDALCSALDWLVALSDWMVEAELTPDSLFEFLTPATEGTLRADDEDSVWLDGFANDFNSLKVSPEIFRNFATWQGSTNSDISTSTWHEHLTRVAPIYRPSGVFLTNTDNEIIEQACRSCLTAAGVDFEQETNTQQLHDLVIDLGSLLEAQTQLIQSRVASLSPSVNAISAEPLILWSQTTCLDLLEALVGHSSEQNTLYWLSEIRRHIAVTKAFELGDVDLWLIAYKPQWLAPELAGDTLGVKPLDLAQLFALQCFATVQVGPATDAAWRGYLALTNEEQPSPEASEELAQWTAGCRETLALLMGCPAEDMVVYLDALLGENSVANTIEQIETLARYIRLAEELCVSASHLLAMKGVSDSQVSGDWNGASVAAQAGLARFQNGSQVACFRQQLAERERDALVAAFMQSKIANDDDLRDEITDSEKLYSYLLLDVNVTSAVPTSRLVEATSSLQLYISRALAGLESHASFIDANGYDRRDALAAQWELDKNYRQWEANQKLLLYPQNYIEPELRYITSPEFDSLLQAVSGGDVSPDSVEAAVNAYMNGLASACDLSVCSFFAERHTDGTAIENASYHVLAKAKWEPGRFFYRKLDADYQTIAELADQSQYLKAMDWTYWQEVSIPKTFELFSDVTVCVFKNRYYFLWLEIEERRNQTPDGPQPSWRLHPRYMRCDQNALVGPMLTPGVFIEGEIHSSIDTLTLDGAFEWSGSKPVLNGTYHPTRAPDGLVYGQLNESNDRSPISKETFTVTFGVDFMGQSGTAVEQAGEGEVPLPSETSKHRAALHIRLSEGWSDAIIDLGAEILTHFDHKAPSGYQSIYPNLVLETNAVALQYTVSSKPDTYSTIAGFYDYTKVDGYNSYKPDSADSTITFLPATKGSANLGSIGIAIDLGERVYKFESSLASAQVKSVKENAGTKLRVRFVIEFLKENAESPMISTTETIVRLTNSFDSKGPVELKRVSHHLDLYTATCSHSTDEQFSESFSLPNDWSFDGETKASITVKAEVTREFGSLKIITNTGTGEKTIQKVNTIIDIGKFDLRPPTGKNNSAWVETGEHGSRNFMHLTDKESRLNDDTFVLLNSSSVLSKLAKTMPRPGGCETLFTAKNQEQAEDYGTFFESDSFPATLDEIYADDTTELNPARLPHRDFDFDSAYGAYGWEVFYDIPAAIAGGYASSGQFDLALNWLQKIFDPQLEIPWRVKPLANATAPQDGLAFDTGEVIVDPDRIARDYPFYYQQATIRQYLEVLLEAGDAAYEDQTQESLQRAKALYVSAKQLFSDTLPEILQSVSNTPWLDPTLGTASADNYDGFLPPYNDELKGIHATLEARLSNLRQWLDLQGEPLNVPLLAQSIDPRQLQRSAKAALTLRGASAEEAEQIDSPLGFSYVIKSTKGYLNNLKLTSHRLQDANEKEGGSQMEEFRMDAAIRKLERAVDLHGFAIMAAEKEVAIKQANVSTSTIALTNHLAQVLAKQFLATADTAKAAITRIKASTMTISNVMLQVSGSVKATIPNTFGFSNGGQNLEQAEMISSSLKISRFLFQWDAGEKSNKAKRSWDKAAEQFFKTGELSSALGAASLALQKANIALDQEKAMLDELNLQADGAQNLRNEWDLVFGGTRFYKPFREDLELLYAEEWAATQEFCRLLIKLYDDETQQGNGATFLRTTSLGSGVTKFNAPHRLAVEIERLETAYLQAAQGRASETSEVPFVLSEVPALGQDHSALEALVTNGEVYFELTDEMFDVFYPGQYDRRIQSININFPGLAKAGINPHARLTQTSNTRYLTRERSQARGAKIRKDRHALQSLVLGACEVDSKEMDAPDGLLKRFQNTGVTSCWHLVIPSVLELKRSKSDNGRNRAWRDAATKRYDALKPHLSEIELKIRFSGRW